MDKKELLGRRIKELRKLKGFTQDSLAEKLEIEPRQLSKLETGKHYPSFETVVSMLKVFDITFEELINFEHLDKDKNLKNILINNIENIDEDKIPNIYKVVRCLIS